MKYIDIFAGSKALATIEQQGISSALFDVMLGASGGPKWFTLFGLDKYLFGEFFSQCAVPLNIVGSSAGAFRFACFAQHNPVKAISQLAQTYATTTYGKRATSTEITEKAVAMVDEILTGESQSQVIQNSLIQLNIIVAKSTGFLVKKESKIPQLAGLTHSYLLNRQRRENLAKHYQRVVFQQQNSALTILDPYNIPTHYVELTKDNIKQAVLASGAIPLVIDGVKNISGAGAGMYRDGGIIDYHFDNRFLIEQQEQKGLTLYPHFSAQPKAGWFDKSLQRSPLTSNYDNVLMITPSAEYIASLPYQKIPDRKDFTKMDAGQRIPYWQKVLAEGTRMADDFHELVEHQSIDKIKPMPF